MNLIKVKIFHKRKGGDPIIRKENFENKEEFVKLNTDLIVEITDLKNKIPFPNREFYDEVESYAYITTVNNVKYYIKEKSYDEFMRRFGKFSL